MASTTKYQPTDDEILKAFEGHDPTPKRAKTTADRIVAGTVALRDRQKEILGRLGGDAADYDSALRKVIDVPFTDKALARLAEGGRLVSVLPSAVDHDSPYPDYQLRGKAVGYVTPVGYAKALESRRVGRDRHEQHLALTDRLRKAATLYLPEGTPARGYISVSVALIERLLELAGEADPVAP